VSTYNGWRNYETWNVALWLDNSEGSFEYWRERAEEHYRDAVDSDSRKEDAAQALADEIEAEHTENMPTVTGVYADLLGASLSSVDWREIAEHYVDDVADEIDSEEAAEVAEVAQ